MRRREFIVGWWDGGLVSRGRCGAQQPAMRRDRGSPRNILT